MNTLTVSKKINDTWKSKKNSVRIVKRRQGY